MKKVKKGNDIAIYWPENKNPFFLICPWQGVHFKELIQSKLQKKKTSEQIAEELEESVEVIEKIIKAM